MDRPPARPTANETPRRPPGSRIALLLAAAFLLSAPAESRAEAYERNAGRDIPAPFPVVWAKLAEPGRWPAFTPGLHRIERQAANGLPDTWRFVVASHGFTLAYSARIELRRQAGTIRIVLDERAQSDIEALVTEWRLTASADGRSTWVELESHFRSGMPVPGFLEAAALGRSVEATLARLAELVATEPRSPAKRAAPVRSARADDAPRPPHPEGVPQSPTT